MKICFVLAHFPPHIGGGETLFKQYTTRLARSGCEVKVLTSNSGGIEGTVREDGVEITYFPWAGPFGHPIPRKSDLYETIEWSDIVHTATFTPGPVALSAAKKIGRPCLITVYEALGKKLFWIENKIKSSMFYLFERYAIKKDYSMFHAISQATKRDLVAQGVDEQRIITIYPGVDEAFYDCLPLDHHGEATEAFGLNQRKVFLFYGRPGKTKGVFILLDAIRTARANLAKDFEFVFVITREPSAEHKLFRRLVETYRLDDIVTIRDSLSADELIRTIQGAYCVIIPSITEGFGYAAAESCALGKPVVASDGGSLPEVISGRVLMFKNRDSDDLAEKIVEASHGQFTEISRKVFSWETSINRLLNAYARII